jgi:hypothetical protein
MKWLVRGGSSTADVAQKAWAVSLNLDLTERLRQKLGKCEVAVKVLNIRGGPRVIYRYLMASGEGATTITGLLLVVKEASSLQPGASVDL